jgi:hypothetical protein
MNGGHTITPQLLQQLMTQSNGGGYSVGGCGWSAPLPSGAAGGGGALLMTMPQIQPQAEITVPFQYFPATDDTAKYAASDSTPVGTPAIFFTTWCNDGHAWSTRTAPKSESNVPNSATSGEEFTQLSILF